MKLIEALNLISQDRDGAPLAVGLACGFTPLHLQTFLHAELQQLFQDRSIEIVTGLYGDVAGTLKETKGRNLDAVAVALEWEDLDPRLGIRQLGGWRVSSIEDILEASKLRLSLLERLLIEVSFTCPVVISLPTLPLPPVFVNVGWQGGGSELLLRGQLASFVSSLALQPRIRFVNEQRLHSASPFSTRLNVKSDWASGFPYNIPHASALAAMMARLVQNPPSKKGLITDLDNTLWSGIVGEVGPEGVSWDLDHKSQAHGLYQQFLRLLSEEGVLVGVASKNDPAVVNEAFKRGDLLLSAESVFPMEVSWGSKASAVSRILSVWNIAASAVVFVDDSPLELAEVKTSHPDIECLLFKVDEPQAAYEQLFYLRDLFGKSFISQEDEIRLASIRQSATINAVAGDEEGFSEELLEKADAELVFSLRKDANDTRAFELINKTNQFNLNGRRVTEAAWLKSLGDSDRFLLTASYSDRFGVLGKIAVISGSRNSVALSIDSWVMSCRAFARRIEHQCLNFLFKKFGVDRIGFDYQSTDRNGPLTSFFQNSLQQTPAPQFEISKEQFARVSPKLFHRTREAE